jgi:diacylglycerol kinase
MKRRHGLGPAFRYAFAGFAEAWRAQPNLRIHTVAAAAVVALGVVLRLRPLAWGLVALAIGLVVAAELLNTAIEAAVDLASPEDHPLAKLAKDAAAAGVLAAALAAAAAGVAIAVDLLSR